MCPTPFLQESGGLWPRGTRVQGCSAQARPAGAPLLHVLFYLVFPSASEALKLEIGSATDRRATGCSQHTPVGERARLPRNSGRSKERQRARLRALSRPALPSPTLSLHGHLCNRLRGPPFLHEGTRAAPGQRRTCLPGTHRCSQDGPEPKLCKGKNRKPAPLSVILDRQEEGRGAEGIGTGPQSLPRSSWLPASDVAQGASRLSELPDARTFQRWVCAWQEAPSSPEMPVSGRPGVLALPKQPEFRGFAAHLLKVQCQGSCGIPSGHA